MRELRLTDWSVAGEELQQMVHQYLRQLLQFHHPFLKFHLYAGYHFVFEFISVFVFVNFVFVFLSIFVFVKFVFVAWVSL